MTQEEMHIAVAEWMGWKISRASETVWNPKGELAGHDDNWIELLPPLTLDWLHECEERIFNKRDWENYVDAIIQIQPRDQSPIRATKEQRLEALCRTLFPERFA